MSNGGGKTKLDRSLLDEASRRDLAGWARSLGLDPALLRSGDDLERWMERCGAEIRRDDEGGAVARGPAGSAFLYISADQLAAVEGQLLAVTAQLPPTGDEESGEAGA
jgi:hypothetical protein